LCPRGQRVVLGPGVSLALDYFADSGEYLANGNAVECECRIFGRLVLPAKRFRLVPGFARVLRFDQDDVLVHREYSLRSVTGLEQHDDMSGVPHSVWVPVIVLITPSPLGEALRTRGFG